MHMDFRCRVIYDNKKTGNNANAVVQPPSGIAHSAQARRHPSGLELGWKGPLPSQAEKFSLRALALILDFPSGGGGESPRGKWFKQTEQIERAKHQA